MFLRNYDNYMAALMLGFASEYESGDSSFYRNTTSRYFLNPTSAGFSDNNITSKSSNGSVTGIIVGNASGDDEYLAPIALSSHTICLGTGNTAVTYDDYNLSGEVITYPLVFVERHIAWDSESRKFKHSAIFTCSNTGDTDVTISEWGIFRPLCSSGDYSAKYNNNDHNITLMFREVLDEPVTIAAGTTGTLTLTLDVPMPNHP